MVFWLGSTIRLVVKIVVPLWVPYILLPHFTKDPKGDHHFVNHPYILPKMELHWSLQNARIIVPRGGPRTESLWMALLA